LKGDAATDWLAALEDPPAAAPSFAQQLGPIAPAVAMVA
jgi:hypothetical protein